MAKKALPEMDDDAGEAHAFPHRVRNRGEAVAQLLSCVPVDDGDIECAHPETGTMACGRVPRRTRRMRGGTPNTPTPTSVNCAHVESRLKY